MVDEKREFSHMKPKSYRHVNGCTPGVVKLSNEPGVTWPLAMWVSAALYNLYMNTEYPNDFGRLSLNFTWDKLLG